MYVGVGRIELSLADNFSLKGKRSVVKSVIRRTQNQFRVAMAEVEDNDVHTRAVLGFAVVGNDKRFINSVVDKVIDFVEGLGEAPVADAQFVIERYL